MKKFIFSTMAALLLFVTGASVPASAVTPPPTKGPVEQFISLFNRFFVLNYISSDLDSSKDKAKASVLEDLEGEAAGEIVELFDKYGSHVLTSTEKITLANFIDLLYSMSEGDTDAKTLARLKNEVYSLYTMSDLYAAILNQDSGAPKMLTYTYKDVTVSYPFAVYQSRHHSHTLPCMS